MDVPKSRILVSKTFDYKGNTDINNLVQEQYNDSFNSVNVNMLGNLHRNRVMSKYLVKLVIVRTRPVRTMK